MKNKILIILIIILVVVFSLYVYSFITAPKFNPSDCDIFKNKGKPIDVNDGGHFYPLDYKLCEYCGVKC